MDLNASLQGFLIRKTPAAPPSASSTKSSVPAPSPVNEDQLAAWESSLAQRAAEASRTYLDFSQEKTALTQLVSQLQQMGMSAAPEAVSALGWEPASAPSGNLLQAREAAAAARRQALEARARAAQAWEEEISSQTSAMEQSRRSVAAGRAWATQALSRPRPAPPAVSLRQAVVVPLGAPKGAATTSRPAPRLPQAEQRVHARVPVAVRVDFESDDNFYTGLSSDISEGGVFVATQHLRPLGSEIDLSLVLPTGGSVQVRGHVRWIRDVSPFVDRSAPMGMGVQFHDLPAEAAGAIHQFLGARDPILYDE